MSRRTRLLPALWLLALLAAPMVAWLAGARQPLLTNEPKKEFPAVNRGSLRDAETFRGVDGALLDRLPFRKEALELHASILIDFFGVSPNPDIGIGDYGWLYFAGDNKPCLPEDAAAQNALGLAVLDTLGAALTTAGYRTTITIVAGKQFIREEGAHSFALGVEACMRRLRDEVDKRLRGVPGGLVIDAELRALEARGEPTFMQTDTHWNWRGRLLVASRILDRIRPGLADEVGLSAGEWHARPTDLNNMLGRTDATERDRSVGVERLPHRPLRPGSVVMVGDSQLGGLLSTMGPDLQPLQTVFAEQTPSCTWAIECPDAIVRADTLVFESVLRELHSLQFQCTGLVAIAANRAAGRPARYTELDGAPLAGGERRLEMLDGAGRVARFAAGDDRDDVIRLVKVPVERLGASADGAPPQVVATPQGVGPCSTTTVDAADRSLVFTVPAGSPLSELSVGVTAPPGTRLGAPEVIVLDGTDRRPRDATR